jgi:YD repeat-containing protein
MPMVAMAQKYVVSAIPDSLKENADAVKRYEELYLIIKSPSKAIIKHKYAITVLNSSGNKYAYYYNSYDKLSSLQDISGYLYDADGKELKKVKKKIFKM